MSSWQIIDDKSSVEINGKSSLHPIHGRLKPGTLTGTVQMTVNGGIIDVDAPSSAHIEFPLTAISFGNAMYDRELPKRLETNRYPAVTLDLEKVEAAGPGDYRVSLQLALHGKCVTFDEQVHTTVSDDDTVVVSGEHHFDIRQFGIEPPKMLGMKVHPEFAVTLSLTARRSEH